MSGYVNRRGWIVRESIASDDGRWCVDLFEDPNGGFGFEQFRSDPEDGGSWTPISGFSVRRFDSLDAAERAAVSAIPWFADRLR